MTQTSPSNTAYNNTAYNNMEKLIGEISLSVQARSVWGKTDREDGTLWLPLYVHMADSAFVARHIWCDWLPEGTRRIIARDLENNDKIAEQVVTWLAGVHDIGKATPVFQSKPIQYSGDGEPQSMAWKPKKYGLPMPSIADTNKPTHPIAGEYVLGEFLTSRYSHDGKYWNQDTLDTYCSIIGSHHGKPPLQQNILDIRDHPSEMGQRLGIQLHSDQSNQNNASWESVQQELIQFVLDIANLTDSEMEWLGTHPLSPQSQVLITAIVIMADWIASNSEDELFPLIPVISSNDDASVRLRTWEALIERSQQGWDRVQLPPSWQLESLPPITSTAEADDFFTQRFTLPEGAHPRPTQQRMIEICSSVEDPGIVVLEAPMGEGKTEAALAAAEILGRKTGRGGVCVALPTMATTDAMFSRVHAWINSLPNGGNQSEKSVWLAHGKARLNEEFHSLVRSANFAVSSIDDEGEEGLRLEGRMSAEAVVADWLRGRKKGVLSNFLVCTVDQVLMSALNVKHVMLRQLAMANKVVIIDECHAYDAYMQEYLKRALEWLGGFNTPVILLSATLPTSQKDQLVKAYLEGKKAALGKVKEKVGPRNRRRKRQCNEEVETQSAANITHEVDTSYPLITYTEGLQTQTCAVSPSGRRLDVSFRLIDDDASSLGVLLQQLLQDGGCAGVICNTVKRAQQIRNALAQYFDSNEIMLTHSRFIDLDRMSNETTLRNLLGPRATRANGKRPYRLIVVGTQVLEQSLDIDFDIMVSDIAPVDLLMQRVGRLHRHNRGTHQCERPEVLRKPICYVRGIEDWSQGTPIFASDFALLNKKRVYEYASLMETLAVLHLTDSHTQGTAQLPADIARSVRTAYALAKENSVIPEAWQSVYIQAFEQRIEDKKEAACKARTYLMKALPDMVRNTSSLLNFYGVQSADNSKTTANESEGNRAVRDTQETIEVMLLRRHNNGVALLPWIGEPSQGIELGASVSYTTVPNENVARILSQCTVRLPHGMTYGEDGIDGLIGELESACADFVMAWQESPWLAGQLAVIFDTEDECGVFSTRIRDGILSYSAQEGLKYQKDNT